MVSVRVGDLEFVEGEEYVRKDIHATIGGQIQGGISTPKSFPVILLFTSDSGKQHGYGYDGWKSKDVFHYTGEGQPSKGSMRFTGGNRAIRDHVENGERILLFKQMQSRRSGKRVVRFEGEMVYRGHRIEKRDSEDNARDVIVFELSPIG